MSGPVIPLRRGARRNPAAQVGNVVPLHAEKETTEDIVRDVRECNAQMAAEISAKLQDLVRITRERHMERARECVTIGCAMDGSTLDEWVEIGERMLAARGGRRR